MQEIMESMERNFWTELEELVEDLKDAGLEVTDFSEEYVAVASEDDEESLLYLGHANRTIWIEKVCEM